MPPGRTDPPAAQELPSARRPERVRPRFLAVATDLDGTLLGSAGTVSARTVRAVEAARDSGIAVLPATARPPAAMLSACKPAPVGPLAVCSNGSVLVDVDSGEVIHHHQLPSSVARMLMSTLREALPDMRFAVETLDQFHYEEGMIEREAALRWGIATPPVHDMNERLDAAITKLCCWHPRMKAAETAAAVATAAGELASVTSAGADWALVGAPGITKAAGLTAACGRLSITSDRVLAVGDELNDLPMLAWAGRSAAVGNARAEVLGAVADEIPPNVEDGVAQLLEWLVQGEYPRPSPAAPRL